MPVDAQAQAQAQPLPIGLITPATHPDHAVVGMVWDGWDGFSYFCDSYDPAIGYWMTLVGAPADRRADTSGPYRRNVSERAIHRTFHRPRTEKVLFLDIDGVLLTAAEFGRRGLPDTPKARVALLIDVLRRTGARIVVSSTRREADTTRTTLQDLGIEPIHRDWRTPVPLAPTQGSIIRAATRGQEIAAWLADHPEVCGRYAMVDDEAAFLPDQLPRLVRTSFETGLDRDAADRLIRILGEDRP